MISQNFLNVFRIDKFYIIFWTVEDACPYMYRLNSKHIGSRIYTVNFCF